MNPGIILLFLKNNVKPIIAFLLTITIIVIVWRIVKNVKKGTDTIIDHAVENAEDNVVANQLNITVERLKELRDIALEISLELETNKDASYLTEAFHVIWNPSVLAIMKKVNSYNEMRAVKTYYKNEFTKAGFGNLKDDILKQTKFFGVKPDGILNFPYAEAL
jgi:hypothetical protein